LNMKYINRHFVFLLHTHLQITYLKF
jgi:hypothetical protein